MPKFVVEVQRMVVETREMEVQAKDATEAECRAVMGMGVIVSGWKKQTESEIALSVVQTDSSQASEVVKCLIRSYRKKS